MPHWLLPCCSDEEEDAGSVSDTKEKLSERVIQSLQQLAAKCVELEAQNGTGVEETTAAEAGGESDAAHVITAGDLEAGKQRLLAMAKAVVLSAQNNIQLKYDLVMHMTAQRRLARMPIKKYLAFVGIDSVIRSASTYHRYTRAARLISAHPNLIKAASQIAGTEFTFSMLGSYATLIKAAIATAKQH